MNYPTVEEGVVNGVPWSVMYDENPNNPYEMFDTASHLLIGPDLARNYNLGEERTIIGEARPSVIARWLTLCDEYAIALPFTFQDYGSSGARTWLDSPPYDEDERAAGFVVMTKTKYAEEFTSHEQAMKCLKAEFAEFAAYIEGEVFGWSAGTGRHRESVWGYYGDLDYVTKEAMDTAAVISAFIKAEMDDFRRDWELTCLRLP